MTSAISSYGLEKRLAGGETVDVGVGEDSGEREVGDEIFPRPSSLSRSTLPHSPSSWQKVDLSSIPISNVSFSTRPPGPKLRTENFLLVRKYHHITQT